MILHPLQIAKAPKVPQTAEVVGLSTSISGAVAIAITDISSIDAPTVTPAPPSGVIVNFADRLTYTVRAQLPSGGYLEQSGVKPSVPRPRFPLLVEAFVPASNEQTGEPLFVYPGLISNGKLYLTCAEMPYRGPCT